MGLSINDSVYSSLFFFLTGLHFFHLLFGLFLCCLLFWSCSFSFLFPISAQRLYGQKLASGPQIILEFPYLWVPTIKGPQDDYEFFGLVLVSTVNSCSTFHSLFLIKFQTVGSP